MLRRLALCALAIIFCAPLTATAADAPATPAALTPAESRFVAMIQVQLPKRYPTPEAAMKAGYVRYTNEDETGAISYENGHWTSTDPLVPSQLWYDVHGRLIGADYSVLQAEHPAAPSLFGIDPSRFGTFHAHVHYVVKNGDGTLTYSRAVSAAKYQAAGGDLNHVTAAGLVKTGAVPSADQVATVFLFPAIWDASVWIIPNPAGAFAEKNPNVTPSHKPNPGDMN